MNRDSQTFGETSITVNEHPADVYGLLSKCLYKREGPR